MQLNLREIWSNYRAEVVFGVVLAAVMVLSYWLATYIPENIFETIINPIEYAATTTVCFYGGWVMMQHHEGMIIRKSWAAVLFIWGCIDLTLIILRFGLHISAIGSTPDNPLYNASVTLGNILAWMLFIYPAQALRPGWLTWWRALLFVAPAALIGILDYCVGADLLLIIMIYPLIIFLAICTHIRKYRMWCESNFSSMERIDVQWIVRYLIILALLGISFYFICFWHVPNRMFTQQWMLFFILAYGTEQILFRKDPWEGVTAESVKELSDDGIDEIELTDKADNQRKLEEWLTTEKPYLNPDFKLIDLREVLPMNRTYLSQFINAIYGCSFYQFVNRYRIEEAKQLMRDYPELRLADVATRSGFSSREVFSRTFTTETGVTPGEWRKNCNNT